MRWRRSETKSRLPTTYAVWMPSAFKKATNGVTGESSCSLRAGIPMPFSFLM